MADISHEILELNNRVAKAKETKIRLQSKRDTLQKNLDSLIAEIQGAGYEPTTLKADRERLERELTEQKQALEEQLAQAEQQLSSIPE